MALQLRYYQEESITAVMRDMEAGQTRVIVALPTGTGKSAVQNNIVKRHYPVSKYRSIFIGGLNRALNYQGMRGFIKEYPDCQHLIEVRGRMRPGIGIVMGRQSAPDARIVVASAQTIAPPYLKDKKAIENQKITPEDVVMRDGGIYLAAASERRWLISARMDEILAFGPLHSWLHDECHHAVSDTMLFTIKQLLLIYEFLELPPMHIIGFTATPSRNDERALANVFQRISYEMSYEDAQREGWLAPLAPNMETVKILTDVKPEQGDSAEQENIDAAINWDERIIAAYKEKAPTRTAVAFVGPINGLRAVEASRHLSKKFNEAGIASVHVDAEYWIDEQGVKHGNSEKGNSREDMMERALRGKIKVICNFNVFVEGVDLPILDCVLLARSVNEVSFTQILGRILRLFPGNPEYGIPAKTNALLIDFTGQPLVTVAYGTMVGTSVDPFSTPLPKEVGDKPETITIRSGGGNLRDDVPFGYVMGKDNVYHPISIGRKSKHVWHIASDAWMSMSIGEKNAVIITAPHYGTADKYLQMMNRENLDEDTMTTLDVLHSIFANFSVWHIKDGAVLDGEAKRQSPELDEIERFAGQYAEERPEYASALSKKGRGWRSPNEMASAAQIAYLKGLLSSKPGTMQRVIEQQAAETFTKNLAAQMITHELARRAIQNLLDAAISYVDKAVT